MTMRPCICGKVTHPSKQAALNAASLYRKEHGGPLKDTYKCREASGRAWHIGTLYEDKLKFARAQRATMSQLTQGG